MRPGEQLQLLVEILERVTARADNLRIESPKRLPDKDTGRLREHDVVLTFSMEHHELIVALECRDRSRSVGVPEVEAFKKKCERTGVHRGIIVSSVAFARTALAKARTMDIGCFSLSEIEKFDWCQAPGIICHTREIIEGPNFQIFPTVPVTTAPALYDEEGCLTSERLRAIAFDCMNNRPSDIAATQDAEAFNSPVGIRFIDPNPSRLYVLSSDNERVPLHRLEITLRYQLHSTLVPFKFQQYVDRETEREIYAAALAPINAGELQGNIVLHKVESEHIEVIFVPRRPSTHSGC